MFAIRKSQWRYNHVIGLAICIAYLYSLPAVQSSEIEGNLLAQSKSPAPAASTQGAHASAAPSSVPASASLSPSSSQSASADPVRVFIEAGVNKDQEAQIRKLAKIIEGINIQRAHQIMELLDDIRKLTLQPDLDEKKLLADQKQVNDLQADMAMDRIRFSVKIRKVLTPEQKAKLVSLMEKNRKGPSIQ